MTFRYPVLQQDLTVFKTAVSMNPSVYIAHQEVSSTDDNVLVVFLSFSDPRDLVLLGITFRSQIEVEHDELAQSLAD